jgi:hypothetical protein
MKHLSCCALLALSLSLILSSCEKDNTDDLITLRVNHYQQPVNNHEAFMGLAYLVQEGDDIGGESWTWLAARVADFDYELGFVYDIEVRKTVVDPSLMDAADKYTFVRLLSKQAVPAETPFDITLTIRYANGFESLVTVGQDSTYSLLGGTVIDGGDFRSDLTAHIAQENGLIGTFVHGVGDTIRLRSLRVQE